MLRLVMKITYIPCSHFQPKFKVLDGDVTRHQYFACSHFGGVKTVHFDTDVTLRT